MNYLLKNTTVLDPASSHFNTKKDILIEDGILQKIAPQIEEGDATVIQGEGLHASQSWVDLKADFCDPGREINEDIQSGLLTAVNGGFGHVFIVPSTDPVVDSKSQIKYIQSQVNDSVADIHAIGAITKGLKGDNLAEMYDMYSQGVRLFSDDTKELSAGILYRALLYCQNFGGQLVSFPQNRSLSANGQVNEGISSLKTGLQPIPAISEVIQVERDLQLMEYTNARLHFSGISCVASVELIRKAKAKGQPVSCDVHAHQLIFTELNTLNYDTNHKVFPPYRTEEDRLALCRGITDGTIDGIVSNHQPRTKEEKDIEFDHASFGNITLQTLFASLNQVKELTTADIIKCITVFPRKIANFERDTALEEGNVVDITLFNPTVEWTFNVDINSSKSKNSPFSGHTFKGKAIAIVKEKKLHKI